MTTKRERLRTALTAIEAELSPVGPQFGYRHDTSDKTELANLTCLGMLTELHGFLELLEEDMRQLREIDLFADAQSGEVFPDHAIRAQKYWSLLKGARLHMKAAYEWNYNIYHFIKKQPAMSSIAPEAVFARFHQRKNLRSKLITHPSPPEVPLITMTKLEKDVDSIVIQSFALSWPKGALEALDNIIDRSPDPEAVRKIPNLYDRLKYLHALYPTTHGLRESLDKWSGQYGAAFDEPVVIAEDLRELVQALAPKLRGARET